MFMWFDIIASMWNSVLICVFDGLPYNTAFSTFDNLLKKVGLNSKKNHVDSLGKLCNLLSFDLKIQHGREDLQGSK